MDVEQESSAIVISGKLEILPVLNHLPLAADETALLALADALLK